MKVPKITPSPPTKTPLQNDFRVNQLKIPAVANTGTKQVTMNKPKSTLKFMSEADLKPKTRVNRKNLGPNGHWEFERKLGAGTGFIYLIEDAANMRMYIGKKGFYGRGLSNEGVESNWKWYTSSCIPLNAAIKACGKEFFRFYVLDEYRTRGGLAHAEIWSIMHVEALINRDEWYNAAFDAITYKINEPVSELHKYRLKQIIEGCADDLKVF